MSIDLVYKYGCRSPKQHDVAMQLLGQAWLYRDELRRAYNVEKRELRLLVASGKTGDAFAHVASYHRAERSGRVRQARKARGHLVDHGTYWLVEDAILQASRDSGLDPIKGHSWNGTGRIGAAIMSKSKIPVTGVTRVEHPRVTLSEPDDRCHAELVIRIGALPSKHRKSLKEMSEARAITWPIKIDRPLPVGAVIKQISVQRTRSGHRFQWDAVFTISVPEAHRNTRSRGRPPQSADSGTSGVVGIDIGWRREGSKGLRVATHNSVSGSDVLYIDTLEAFLYTDSVRAIRDQTFDDAKEYAAESGHPGTSHARLWRDKERMRRLAVTPAGSGDLGVIWWRERDKHLEDIECGVRGRAIRRRLNVYRVYADKLAKKYACVALEDMPMGDFVGESETHARERVRASASLYLLQNTIAARFGPERTYWIPCAKTSMTCSDCGEVRKEKLGPESHWTCASCQTTHHQDENAAKVIRKICESRIAAGEAATARSRKAKTKQQKTWAAGIATGDQRGMTVTSRESSSQAAE